MHGCNLTCLVLEGVNVSLMTNAGWHGLRRIVGINVEGRDDRTRLSSRNPGQDIDGDRAMKLMRRKCNLSMAVR